MKPLWRRSAPSTPEAEEDHNLPRKDLDDIDNPETPSILEAIEATAADMRRAYQASLQPEWPPGRLAGPLDPTGERCSCGEPLNNGVCPNYPQPKDRD